jgi:hypothetical protein
MRNGLELKRKKTIKREWIRRYKLEKTELGTEEDKRFRKEIERQNELRSRDRGYDEDGHSPQWSLLDDFDKQELRTVKGKLKKNKSPADDGVTNEMILRGGDAMQNALLALYNLTHITETIPHHWKSSILVPVYKKGQRTDTQNYRPIGKTAVLTRYTSVC